jgi:hypothetical protein
MSNTTILYLIVAVLGTLALLKAFKRKISGKGHPFTSAYQRRQSLCTPAELLFLKTLDAAIDPAHRVFSMVRLADVVQPTSRHFSALNKVAMKHLDFVVCDRESTRLLYAIELNDRSHDSATRKTRDSFLAGVMQEVGIPLIFLPAASNYDVAALRTKIARCQIPPMIAQR